MTSGPSAKPVVGYGWILSGSAAACSGGWSAGAGPLLLLLLLFDVFRGDATTTCRFEVFIHCPPASVLGLRVPCNYVVR